MLQKHDTCDFSNIIESQFQSQSCQTSILNMESITVISNEVDGMAHDLLMADKENVVIDRFRKSYKLLVWQNVPLGGHNS